MKKILSIVMVALMCCLVFSCNEKPKSYRFVKVTTDGKEEVENIAAKNDTDALKQYFVRMEKILIENIGNPDPDITAMYVISPDGDTLNTDPELLKAFTKDLPTMGEPAEPAETLTAEGEAEAQPK